MYNWLGDSQQKMRQAVGAYSAYHIRCLLTDVVALCFWFLWTFRSFITVEWFGSQRTFIWANCISTEEEYYREIMCMMLSVSLGLFQSFSLFHVFWFLLFFFLLLWFRCNFVDSQSVHLDLLRALKQWLKFIWKFGSDYVQTLIRMPFVCNRQLFTFQ